MKQKTLFQRIMLPVVIVFISMLIISGFFGIYDLITGYTEFLFINVVLTFLGVLVVAILFSVITAVLTAIIIYLKDLIKKK